MSNQTVINVLFVCHGNICRSPMAEFLFKQYVEKLSLQDHFHIASAATSQEEIGNKVYPPAYKLLQQKGIDPKDKRARQVTLDDMNKYDYVLLMDDNNVRNLNYLFNHQQYTAQVFKLLDFTKRKGDDIKDPWYTGNFDITYNDIMEGIEAFVNYLKSEGKI